MRIAVYGEHPSATTGFAKVTRLLCRTLKDLEHEVVVFSYSHQALGPLSSDVIKVIPIPADQPPNLIGFDLVITVGDIWRLAPMYDAVSSEPVPWVAYLGCEGLNYPETVRLSLRETLDCRKIFERITVVWAYTDATKRTLEKQFSGLSVYTLPHAVDTHAIKEAKPIALKSILGIPESRKLAVFVGRNVVRKGIDRIIGWIGESHNTDWCVYLHTEDFSPEYGLDLREFKSHLPERIFLRSDLEKFGIRLTTDTHIYGIIKGADLYLHPHRAEGFGLTVLEALVAGVPTLATFTGGPATYLPKKCQIPHSRITPLQIGGVGYWVNEPETPNPLKGKRVKWATQYTFDESPFTLKEFNANLDELLHHDYKAVTWVKA